MADYDFDLFTIGGGSGGVRASRLAGAHGARVGLAEERDLGGTCVNVGCIPKKLFVYASEVSEECDDAAGFGWTIGRREFDWRRLVENKNREIARLNGVYRRLLEGAGVEILDARARILDPHTVEVGGRRVTAKTILVATGSWPRKSGIPGQDLAVSSNEAFHLESLPRRVVLAGGGYIAVEFAGIFHGLGCEVTLVHRGECVLRGFDDDVRFALAREMEKRGIRLRLEHTIERIDKHGGAFRATLDDGEVLETDLVMSAIGRDPNTKGLGLEEAGVTIAPSGAIVVDEYSKTTADSIYAIGDCTNRMNLTPVAIAEGQAFFDTVFRDRPMPMDYRFIPSAVFSQPNVGAVGLSEAQAREHYGDVEIYRSTFRPLKHTLSGRDEQTVMKLVVDPVTDRVLGCHMLGPDAGEIIQGFAVALKCGATKAQLDSTVGIHPTAAEEFVTMRVPQPKRSPTE